MPHGKHVALLCLDLDRFNEVNDALGHAGGDALLKLAAERLRSCVPEADFVARLGGDAFAIVQLKVEGPNAVALLAGRITQTMKAPYLVKDHELIVGVSIGIALAPADGKQAEELLKRADAALFKAKSDAPGSYRFFEAGMNACMQARRLLEADLRKALENGQLHLEYQPLISIETNAICGCEALLRWHHPQRGKVSPAEFIPVAEATGLIVPIGDWALHQACTEAAAWPEGVKVAVNLSVAQFKSQALVASVKAALAVSGLQASRLELEITESVLLDGSESTLDILQQLHGFGVRIALDDFGTGYSSLRYLGLYPFDKIKIDRCFIAGLSKDDPSSRAIVRAVARLGASLGMGTTAEGIETAEQLEAVRAEGCTEAQGYYFNPSKPADEIRELLRSNVTKVRETVTRDVGPLTATCAVEREEERLQALYAYNVLDTTAEESFDRITRLARLALKAPMAMISFVDRDRQWFKSRQGMDAEETPRNISFCTHTIKKEAPLVVGDALLDPRFCNSPLVTGAPHVRAYVGVPLRTSSGHNIGALCVNDIEPREITSEQLDMLQDLARLAVDELELRKMAMTDSLTGALTGRAFEGDGNRELQRARRQNSNLACIMLDIDHFKRINDTYGHAAGDQVLQTVVTVCNSQLPN